LDKVRFGIVGIGSFGSGHTKRIIKDVENMDLTAVCDTDPARAEWAAENLPDIKFFDNAEDMFKSGMVDAVLIATPHYDHPPLTMLAFTYGLHVLVEKPAGVYTKQVREMNVAAEKHPELVYGMMYNQRTNSLYRKMKEMIDGGELGRVRRFVWIISDWYRSQFYYDSGGWRATWKGEGGGALINQCPHQLDLWQWIVGMPVKIMAHTHNGKWHNIEVEDDVTAYAEFANGATGVFITSTGDAPGTNRLEITGDCGKLVCENDKLIFHKLSMPEQEFTKVNTKHFGKPDVEVIEVEHDGENQQHTGVFRAFANKILGKGELVASGHEGIHGLMISNAIHLSSWLGKPVELPIDEDLFYEELKKRFKD